MGYQVFCQKFSADSDVCYDITHVFC